MVGFNGESRQHYLQNADNPIDKGDKRYQPDRPVFFKPFAEDAALDSLKLLTSYHYTTESAEMASVMIAVFCDKMLVIIIRRI